MGKRMVVGVLVAILLAAISCKNRSPECRQMRACCKGAKADPHFASLVEKSECATADDPQSCTKAFGGLLGAVIQKQLEDSSLKTPEACIPKP